MKLRAVPSEIITFLLIITLAIAGLLFYSQTKFSAAGPLERAVYFSIDKGDHIGRITSKLHGEGIISSKLVFQIGAYLEQKQNQLKFGLFEIPAQASMAEVLEVITKTNPGLTKYAIQLILSGKGNLIRVRERLPGENGNYTEIYAEKFEGALAPEIQHILENDDLYQLSVTVVEGLTSWQIVNAMKDAPFLVGSIDDIPEEGSIAPNTYSIKFPTDKVELLNRMVSSQARILEEEWKKRSLSAPVNTVGDALILASIIEKETGVADERTLVASVFSNRLDKGMLLQTDPTLIYGLTEGKGALGRGLRQSELKKDTPYNTYLHPGLPPTPISNPSRLSIHAALNPAETDYLYFVADGKGGHAFAESYDEHRKNVRVWRELGN